MNEDLDKMLANKRLVSYRVLNWVGTYTKGDICEILEIEKIITNMPF